MKLMRTYPGVTSIQRDFIKRGKRERYLSSY